MSFYNSLSILAVYRRKRNGPSAEPCEAPQETFLVGLLSVPTWTDYAWFIKYDWNHHSEDPEIPEDLWSPQRRDQPRGLRRWDQEDW